MVSQRQTKKMALIALAIVFFLTFLSLSLNAPAQDPERPHREDPSQNRAPPERDPRGDTKATTQRRSPTSKDSRHDILAKDKFVLKHLLNGSMFDGSGRSYETSAPITTSVIHSFSPEVEHTVAAMMVDPPHQQVFYANSPAMIWLNGELVVVLRIWLEKEKYWAQKKWPFNTFQDNFFYTQKFDSYLKPLGPGQIMGIPTPKQFDFGDGPIEPRIFKANDTVFISFNTGMAFPRGQQVDYTVFWDYFKNRIVIPSILGGSPMIEGTDKNYMARDKHWCAFSDHGELYLVYNIDPLRILHCKTSGACKFVHFEGPRSYKFGDFRDHLRGGTPFELYQYPYYIGVAHVTLFKQSNSRRVYTANLVVLHVKPYRVVYVSKQLRLHQEVMTSVPIVRFVYIDDPFIFPVGIILEDPDTLYLGVHINDFSSVVVRMRGLKLLMDEVMRLDQAQQTQNGPPIHSIQDYVHEAVGLETGYKLHKFVPKN